VSYPLSLWAELELSTINAASSQSALSASVSAANNNRSEINAYNSGTTTPTGYVQTATLQAFISVGTTPSVGSTLKLALRAATNDVQFVRNGTLGTADTSATMPSAPTRLSVGINPAGAGDFTFGYIRRIAVFNSALTDAQLQTTTS
jgi:hypothetical protein